jgi:hypothetical protein
VCIEAGALCLLFGHVVSVYPCAAAVLENYLLLLLLLLVCCSVCARAPWQALKLPSSSVTSLSRQQHQQWRLQFPSRPIPQVITRVLALAACFNSTA